MRSHGIDHGFRFTVAADELAADNGVRTRDFVVERFAYVVQEPRAFGVRDIGSKFGCDQSSQPRYFHGVIQDVL
jgi:hypothetical protein